MTPVTLDDNAINNAPPIVLGSIGGEKFDDLNGDGIEEAGDNGVPGVTINLWIG